MNKQKLVIFLVVALLVGSTAVFLSSLRAEHRLGPPGLKLADEPGLGPDNSAIGTNSVALPTQVLDYRSEPLAVTQIELDWLPRDTTFGRRRYIASDGFYIDLSTVLMGTDRTSIHKPQICLTGQGWNIDSSELLSIPVARPHRYDLPVMKLVATAQFDDKQGKASTVRGIYVYWFVSDTRLTARHGERMWWMAKDLITTRVLPRWAYISFFSVCRPGAEEAVYQRMKDFIAESVPEFQTVAGSPASVGEKKMSSWVE